MACRVAVAGRLASVRLMNAGGGCARFFGLCGVSRYNGGMHITLNGSPLDCSAATVAELLDEAGYAGRRVAVELNHDIVPRSRHASQPLAEGDQVEIVHAIGGG